MPPPEVQPTSWINLPFTVPVRLMERRLEAQVPHALSNVANPMIIGQTPLGQLGIRYRIRRDPLTFNATGDQIAVGLHGYYRVALVRRTGGGWMQVGGCGVNEPEREIVAGLASALHWTPEWRIGVTTRRQGLVLLKDCDLSVLGLKVDVTGVIRLMLGQMLDQATHQADRQLAEDLNFYPRVSNLWERLNQAIPLAPGVLLDVAPQSIAPIKINISGGELRTGLRLQAIPVCRIGQAPALAARRPLPAVQATDPADPRSKIYLLAVGTYGALNQLLNDRNTGWVGQPLQYGPWATRIESVRLSHLDGRPLLELNLLGVGRLALSATPVFDPQTQRLQLSDLQYHLETGHVWLRVASRLLHPVVRYALEKAVTRRLNDRLVAAEAGIDRSLNRQIAPAVRVEGGGLRIGSMAMAIGDTQVRGLVGLTLRVSGKLVPGGSSQAK